MPGVLQVRLAVSIGALACVLVACGADEGDPAAPPTGVSGTGAESGSTAGAGTATGAGSSPGSAADPSTGTVPGTGASCDPSTSITAPAASATGTAPGDSLSHSQDPAGNCVIDSGVPRTPVDP
ncbi:hypothetical protein ABZX85_37625 [Streptomyces sp. NPDC004539]|uniref:hypothetical protein n=1 Tax=Streptomyces sp. NPDC004539 TaxID=3154280 RepID=UPI0033AE9EE1